MMAAIFCAETRCHFLYKRYSNKQLCEREPDSVRYITLRGALHQNVATITFHCVAILILVAFLDIFNVAEKAKKLSGSGYTTIDPTASQAHAGSSPFMSSSRMCCLPADVGAAAERLPSTADRRRTASTLVNSCEVVCIGKTGHFRGCSTSSSSAYPYTDRHVVTICGNINGDRLDLTTKPSGCT
jgi:hypothetical protein